MNVKSRRSSAVTVPAVSPASAITHQKLWQKLRVEALRGGGEREPWGMSFHPGREKLRASERELVGAVREPPLRQVAQAGGVQNDGNECAVLVSKRPADDQGGAGFPRHAEIDQPDLAAAT